MISKRPIKRSSRKTAYDRIRLIIEKARGNVARAINTEMVMAYWHIGREIVEEEQKGKKRAEYGKNLIENLSLRLSEYFGKGFDGRNLFYMRQFYLTYPKLNALRSQLSLSILK
jgi:hypothetical protein